MMQDRYTWTASLGRWLGVPIRLHVLFVLFAIVVFLVQQNASSSTNPLAGTAIATILIFLVSVLLHELAHVFANINLGGQIEDVTLAPWGGQSRMLLPPSPRAQLLVHLAGPFANAIIFAVGALLLTQSKYASLGELMNPFQPFSIIGGSPEISILKIVTWTNFQLLIINLLPVHPFDGSYALRSAIKSHNPSLPSIKIETAILVIGIGTSLVIIGLAWVVRDQQLSNLFPGWFLFSMAGITLISTARYGFHIHTLPEVEDWGAEHEEFASYDHLYDEEDLLDFEAEESDDISISQWLQEKQDSRESLELAVEVEEERRADRILDKLHHQGIESLSEDEKSLLNRVSARYRRKRPSNS